MQNNCSKDSQFPFFSISWKPQKETDLERFLQDEDNDNFGGKIVFEECSE